MKLKLKHHFPDIKYNWAAYSSELLNLVINRRMTDMLKDGSSRLVKLVFVACASGTKPISISTKNSKYVSSKTNVLKSNTPHINPQIALQPFQNDNWCIQKQDIFFSHIHTFQRKNHNCIFPFFLSFLLQFRVHSKLKLKKKHPNKYITLVCWKNKWHHLPKLRP